ncbi:LysR family transcriptional regulator [Agarilytica rhodophyticola]|uniref:LysR family transcriptional regulator n=1 Tax=Agarilytica rhodophyticola TaxID=1737490 RepID=UPI000B34684E|nr:LysR family transcriptional regulator [Agarilytica rhodophyticola]
MSTINLNHLRLFAIFSKVVETGSFAEAARKLETSRSRVSEQVAKLESDIGVRLIQRSTRQLTITDEGQQVYEQARKLSMVLTDIEAVLAPSHPRGQVSITMPHHIAHLFMSRVLKDFQHTYPDIELNLVLDDYRLNLIHDDVDLAIRVGIPEDESIVARVLHEEQIGLYTSPDYLAEAGPIKTVDDLQNCHWLLLNQSGKSKTQRLNKHGKTIEVTPKSYYHCNSPFMIKEMLIKGLGVGKLLSNVAAEDIKHGKLVPVMPLLTGNTVAFSLIYPSRRQIPSRIQAVIDYLLKRKIFS